MKFTPSFLDNIRSRILVSEVVGKKVKLKTITQNGVGHRSNFPVPRLSGI